MRRRDLVVLAASLAALRPLAARAQQKAMRVGESPERLVYGGHHRARSAGGTE
jgi:hypothetical protein